MDRVAALLGFDGTGDRVALHDASGAPDGANTVNSGSAFLKDWIAPRGGDWPQGWQVGRLEQGLLDVVAKLPLARRQEETAVVWLHNEHDATDRGLTPGQWDSGVRFDAGLVHGASGQAAADLPYLFVSAIRYWASGEGHQAIRIAMEALAADRAFNARIARALAQAWADHARPD